MIFYERLMQVDHEFQKLILFKIKRFERNYKFINQLFWIIKS